MDIREELNRHVLETTELTLDLEMLNNLCAASLAEGVCMADVISYESMGNTDITDELPVSFFSPERSETGVELAGESFFKAAIDKTAQLAKAAWDFVIRIAKAMYKRLFGSKTGSPYKAPSADYVQFRKRMDGSFGTNMHVALLERPQIARDIVDAINGISAHVQLGADDIASMAERIEGLKRIDHSDAGYTNILTEVNEDMHKFIEANWHIAPVSVLSRLVDKDAKVSNHKKYNRRKPGSAKENTPAQDTAADMLTRYKELSNGKGDVSTIGLMGFYNDAPDANDVDRAIEHLGEAFEALTKSAEKFKSIREVIDIKNFNHNGTFADVIVAEQLTRFNKVAGSFYRSISNNIAAYAKASEVAQGVGKKTADLHSFLEQNKEHVK